MTTGDARDMLALLTQIESALDRVSWSFLDAPNDHEHDAVFYVGTTVEGWRFTVASFDVSEQGFPPGTRGHDGACVMGGVVVRMTRDLAEKAFRAASSQREAP